MNPTGSQFLWEPLVEFNQSRVLGQGPGWRRVETDPEKQMEGSGTGDSFALSIHSCPLHEELMSPAEGMCEVPPATLTAK